MENSKDHDPKEKKKKPGHNKKKTTILQTVTAKICEKN
jgi:hypothetical protein